MPVSDDRRLVELKVLESPADRTWAEVCVAEEAGQARALGLPQHMYADLLVTLFEDGFLRTSVNELWRQLETNHRHKSFDMGVRDRTVTWLSSSRIFHEATVTYRGLRRVDELRDQLRRDRVLERFGILLDGRYIISDLIEFLERTNGEPMSLIFGDVDDFKRFNTEHGYKAGDAVLRHVFAVSRRVVGNRGEVYRRGGKEIVALLPYFDLASSLALAERIREEVDKTAVSFDGKELHGTLSLGVAASPPNDPDGPGLETYAEIALKKAKDEGKNRVQS